MTNSMKPLIRSNNYVIIKKENRINLNLQHQGSVVAFLSNTLRDSTTYIKRIIAIPTDTLFLKRDSIKINGFKIPHDPIFNMMVKESDHPDSINHYSARLYLEYILSRSSKVQDKGKYIIDNGNAIIVPDNHYFMVGDNYYESMDSRFWGFIPKENIKGKVVLIF